MTNLIGAAVGVVTIAAFGLGIYGLILAARGTVLKDALAESDRRNQALGRQIEEQAAQIDRLEKNDKERLQEIADLRAELHTRDVAFARVIAAEVGPALIELIRTEIKGAA